MKEKVLMLLACLWLGIGFSMAQAPKTVAGVVTSADDGEPIIGASVLVEGTTMGAITDVDGKFAINNVPADIQLFLGTNQRNFNFRNNFNAFGFTFQSSFQNRTWLHFADFRIRNSQTAATVTKHRVQFMQFLCTILNLHQGHSHLVS